MPNAVGMPYQMRSYCDDLLGGLYHVKGTVVDSRKAFLEG